MSVGSLFPCIYGLVWLLIVCIYYPRYFQQVMVFTSILFCNVFNS